MNKQVGFIEKIDLMSKDNYILTISVFMSLGIMSFFIETITEKIEHIFRKKEHILSLVQHLYRELMNLGIVSFCFVLFDMIGVYHAISLGFEKYHDKESDVFGIFEVVHITIFAIAVFLIIIGSLVIFISWVYSKIWTYYEKFGYQKSEEEFLHKMKLLKDNLFNYINPVFWAKYEFALRRYQFNIMREEFIIMEGLPTSFKFSRYIVGCFRRLASHHIHVSGKIWVFAITLEICVTSTLHIPNSNIGAAVLHAIGYIALIICIMVVIKCRSIICKLVKIHHSSVNLPIINFLDDERNYPSNSEMANTEYSESHSMSEEYSQMRQSLQMQGRKISLNYGIRDIPLPQQPKLPKGIKGLIHKYFGWFPCYHSPYHTTVERLLWFNSHGFIHLLMKCVSITQAIYVVLYVLFYSRSSVYIWEHFIIFVPPIMVLFVLSPLCLSSMTLIRYVDKDRLDDVVKSIIFQSISHKFNKRHLLKSAANKEKNKLEVPDPEMVSLFKNRYLATSTGNNIEQLSIISDIVGSMTNGVETKQGLNIKKYGDITMIDCSNGDVIIRGADLEMLECALKDSKKCEKKRTNEVTESEAGPVVLNDINRNQESNVAENTPKIFNNKDTLIYNGHVEIEMKETIPNIVVDNSTKFSEDNDSSSNHMKTTSTTSDSDSEEQNQKEVIQTKPKNYTVVQKVAQPTTHSVLNVGRVEILDMSDEA